MFVAHEQARNCHKIELPKFGDEPVVTGGNATVSPAIEAYKSLRSRLMKARDSRGISAVVVTSTTHSEGKTITAFNLAYCCAQLEDTPVLLVDADLRSQGLTVLTNNQLQYGLRDALSNAVPYASAVVATDVPNLYLMGAGGGNESPTELLSGASLSQLIAWARESFKIVLIDAPPIGVVADFNLIEAACDGSLIVTRAHKTTQQALEEALGQADPKKVLGVIWNEAKQPSKGYAYGSQRP
jgi:capsular exopolysaccharide synthesis family protein